jgi:hypothetical protein
MATIAKKTTPKQAASKQEAPKTRTAPLSEVFAGTPLADFFKRSETEAAEKGRVKFAKPTPLGEAGSVFTELFGTPEQKAKVENNKLFASVLEDAFASKPKPATTPSHGYVNDDDGYIAALHGVQPILNRATVMLAHALSLIDCIPPSEVRDRIKAVLKETTCIVDDALDEVAATGIIY